MSYPNFHGLCSDIDAKWPLVLCEAADSFSSQCDVHHGCSDDRECSVTTKRPLLVAAALLVIVGLGCALLLELPIIMMANF